jgi:hypothetical protein
VQPIWKDLIHFADSPAGNASRRIDLSGFDVVHAPNSAGKGSYHRLLMQGVLDLIGNVNSNIFSQENKVSTSGQACCSSSCPDVLMIITL